MFTLNTNLGEGFFVAQYQRAAELLRAMLRRPEGSRVAEVQEAGGRWGQTAAVRAGRSGNGVRHRPTSSVNTPSQKLLILKTSSNFQF